MSGEMTPTASLSPSGRNDAREASQLLTAEQVAERFQIPRSHVYRLTREGRLPCVKLGRYRRYRIAEIESFEADGGTE
jgi:excisionase family DNA binding protein